jgi:hypothetical protein
MTAQKDRTAKCASRPCELAAHTHLFDPVATMLEHSGPTAANPIPSLRETFDAFVRIRRKLNPSTVAFLRKYLLSVFAAWLDRPFTEITRERVTMRHAQITEQSGPAHADVAMRSLRSILNFAMIHFEGPNGERPTLENPVVRLSQTRAWNRVARRTTFITEHQLRAWFHAALELKGTSIHTRDALIANYLLLLT